MDGSPNYRIMKRSKPPCILPAIRYKKPLFHSLFRSLRHPMRTAWYESILLTDAVKRIVNGDKCNHPCLFFSVLVLWLCCLSWKEESSCLESVAAGALVFTRMLLQIGLYFSPNICSRITPLHIPGTNQYLSSLTGFHP